mmetsp:Transcript_28907/g.73819  ORF Transcript_28907/g.73819 Transcript_28907/m.73819 type:complete len:209 (-) Transcript_28907:629-1255(-)
MRAMTHAEPTNRHLALQLPVVSCCYTVGPALKWPAPAQHRPCHARKTQATTAASAPVPSLKATQHHRLPAPCLTCPSPPCRPPLRSCTPWAGTAGAGTRSWRCSRRAWPTPPCPSPRSTSCPAPARPWPRACRQSAACATPWTTAAARPGTRSRAPRASAWTCTRRGPARATRAPAPAWRWAWPSCTTAESAPPQWPATPCAARRCRT